MIDIVGARTAALTDGPGLRTVGLWAAEYMLLSLGLGLAWIALVSAGQALRKRREASLPGAAQARPWILARGFRRWQNENGEFAGLPGRLDALPLTTAADSRPGEAGSGATLPAK